MITGGTFTFHRWILLTDLAQGVVRLKQEEDDKDAEEKEPKSKL